MKLGTLVNNRSALESLYQMRIEGDRTLKLRKELKRLKAELSEFDEARDEKIREIGERTEDGAKVEPDTAEYRQLIQYMNEMAKADVEPPEAMLTETDIKTANISSQEIDGLVDIGFLKEDENGDKQNSN